MSSDPGLRGIQQWLTHQAGDVVVELVCAENVGPVAVRGRDRTLIRLSGCAATLELHELVELLALAAVRVVVRLDGCTDPDAARRHLEPTVELLRAGFVDRLCIDSASAGVLPDEPARPARRRRRRVAALEAGAMPISRRGLIGLAGPGGRALPPAAAPARARLIAAMRAVATPTPALGALPGPTRELTARGCVACGVCVQACPERALHLVDGPVSDDVSISTLLLDPAACSGCARCVELCPSQVLALAEPITWDRLLAGAELPVVTVTTALCARCSVRFPASSGERLCPVCSFRRRNPFGSARAPGTTGA